MKPRLACLLLTLCLAGCAGLRPTPPGCVKIGPAGAICLLPPSQWPPVAASHLVRVRHDDQQHTFLGQLEIDEKSLRLAGASLFGTHLFTITWDGTRVSSQPPQPKLHPDLIVATLEVALVDPDPLRAHLHGMKLSVRHEHDREIRELREHGHLVVRIERHGTPLADAHVTVRVPPAHLRLRLTPMSDADQGASR